VSDSREFSLTDGGPFYKVLTGLHLLTPKGVARAFILAVIVWLPVAVGEAVRQLLGGPSDEMIHDLGLHVRVLFTLPVLLLAERLLEASARSAMFSFYSGEFCDAALIDRVVDRALRLRDSWRVELALLTIALASGQLMLWQGATGVFHGGTSVELWTFPRVWYALVALPLVQFVMFRWLWRWAIWTYMLFRFSRLPLSLLATHTDYAGGLAALARPVTGFSGFVMANSAILSAAWGTQELGGRTTLQDQIPMLVTFLAVSLAIAVGPLLLFSGMLSRARRLTIRQYSDLVRSYTLRFHRKWIEGSAAASGELLGSPDMQSLNDLGQAFEVASKTRVFVFGPRTILVLWFAALAPMLPLVLQTVTFEQVLKRIFGIVLGGLPF
jgi:hypothetical protein